jgi:hypothetical protein
MNVMRNIRSICRAGIAVACAALLLSLASCVNPFQGGAAKASSAASTEGASSTVSISLSVPSSKIIVPGAPSIARYQLFGTRSGDARKSLGSWTSLSGASASIQVGTWDFLLDAYDASDKLVLEGSIAGKAISAATSLSFSLAAIQSGSGSVKVTCLWPASGNLVVSVQATLGGTTTQVLTPTAIPPSNLGVSYSAASMAAGNYLLTFKLLDAKGASVAIRSEWVLVRANLESAAEVSLAAADLNYLPTAPGAVNITQGSLDWVGLPVAIGWTDASDNETGFLVMASDDGGSTWATAASLPPGSTSWSGMIPRGISRSYEIRSVNELGSSPSSAGAVAVPDQIVFSTSDQSIASVSVNAWDRYTYAYRGSCELVKGQGKWVGGLNPNATGYIIFQAYAYDAQGRIVAVGGMDIDIQSMTSTLTIAARGARLMGGNVQLTGATMSATPFNLNRGSIGIEVSYVGGIVCDGLNLYITDTQNKRIMRLPYPSGASPAVFAGAGTGADEDNPGQSLVFKSPRDMTTDGKQLFINDGLRVVRVSLKASAKVLAGGLASGTADGIGTEARFSSNGPITSDGAFVYLRDGLRIRRIALADSRVTTLDPADWSWKSDPPSADHAFYGITTDGTKLYWCSNADSYHRYSMPLAGSEAPLISGYPSGNMTTDGGYFYQWDTLLLTRRDLATGSTRTLWNGNGIVNHIAQYSIATNGEAIIGFWD